MSVRWEGAARLVFTIAALLLLSAFSVGAAEPATVWYATPVSDETETGWYPAALSNMRGRIVDYDSEVLRLETEAEGIQRIPAARVVRVSDALPPEIAAVVARYEAGGDAGEAVTELYAAIKTRPAVWVQRKLTAALAGAAFRSNRFDAALELVGSAAKAGLPPEFIAQLPVHWNGTPLAPAAQSAAAQRISDQQPLVRLVAASWLLASAQRNQAESALQSLASSPADPLTARLADSLLWSTFPPNDDRLKRDWIAPRLMRLPIALHAGPLSVLGAKLTAAAQRERALEYLLRVALHYEAPPWVVMQARQDAMTLLRALGRDGEADRLNRLFDGR